MKLFSVFSGCFRLFSVVLLLSVVFGIHKDRYRTTLWIFWCLAGWKLLDLRPLCFFYVQRQRVTVGITPAVCQHELSWKYLARRRERARLCMISKVVHGLVSGHTLAAEQGIDSKPQCTRGSHSWKYAPILPIMTPSNFSSFQAQFLHGMRCPQ